MFRSVTGFPQLSQIYPLTGDTASRGMYVCNSNQIQPHVRLWLYDDDSCEPSFSCHRRHHVVCVRQRFREMLTTTRM